MANDNLSYSQQGILNVSVNAETVGHPIDNARVRITPAGEDSTVIDELTTDSSGRTADIGLAAPPLDYSMEPSDQQPYAEYTLTITADGFAPVRVEGTQLLPYTGTFQPVFLTPRADSEAAAATVVVPPHVLWGDYPEKIAEPEVQTLPPSKGFVVLPEPVIPQFMIVHLGLPDDRSAQNVWVPFKDYIKNVASSEIYANWPQATLRANVLAILSLALNRIYTEWYRGQGYDFTITNSTRFDQAYHHGRNIFDEISVVVDELFTNFITKPGIRQPLFTQYCDGKRVQCPNWMSQWGSKSLGDQGYQAMDILRNYYGHEIYLMSADTVEGVPRSFAGAVLQTGSTGADVRTIQSQLNRIGQNYPAIPRLAEDGVFGNDTLAAVVTFQSIFNLPQTGQVDFSTWYTVSHIYVAVTGMSAGVPRV